MFMFLCSTKVFFDQRCIPCEHCTYYFAPFCVVLDKENGLIQKGYVPFAIKKLKWLNNQNIVTVYDVYQGGEIGCLWSYAISLSCEDVLEIFKQIAAGVKYLHLNDIVHRHIKPENILIPVTVTMNASVMVRLYNKSE